MSRFQNSYLAESVGYNNGHARGIAHGIEAGKQAGFTETELLWLQQLA